MKELLLSPQSTYFPSRVKREGEVCRVCDSLGAHWHYQGLTCSRCRVFFIRCSRLGKPFICKLNGNCHISAKNTLNCAACRLKKCLKIGMKMEDVGVARRHGKPMVRYFESWEKVVHINNVITSLTVYGPKLIDLLEGAKSATHFATIYTQYNRFIDCVDGPSPSSVETTLDQSIFDLLLNPIVCSPRITAALDQMASPQTTTCRFDRSYARIATSFADFVMTLRELHSLSQFDKLLLVQHNFPSYMVAKAIFTKFTKEQNHEILMDLLRNQTMEGAPNDLYMTDINSKLFLMAERTVERTFKEHVFSEREFVLTLAIAMLSAPATLSEEGAYIARSARKRLTTVLACYLDETYPQWSEEDRRLRLRVLLGTISHFRDLARVFADGIVMMATNNWGNMRGQLVTDFHLKHFT